MRKSLADGLIQTSSVTEYTVPTRHDCVLEQLMVNNTDSVNRTISLSFSFKQPNGSFGTERQWASSMVLGPGERAQLLPGQMALEENDFLNLTCDAANVVSFLLTGDETPR